MTGLAHPWPGTRRPLSVVVFGNSQSLLQIPPRSDRDDGLYAEVLADRLATAGVPVQVTLSSRWFDFLHRAVRDYESRVRTYLPDVLVVQFGLNECQPWLVPVSLIRHLLREHDAVTRTARRYRRHVARPLWKRVRWFRRRIAGTVGTRTWQTTPRRFAGHLDRLLSTATYEGRPLVLVLDLDDPRGTLAHFLPGMPERIETYREVIRSTVAKYADRDVRLVPVSELTRGRDDLLADGMHYTPEAHRIIGERLAAEVVDWLSARGG